MMYSSMQAVRRKSQSFLLFSFLVVIGLQCFVPAITRAESKKLDLTLFDQDNLVAWCVVPFDKLKRGPQERAAMLSKLGIKRLAYDYRAEHVPTFDEEIEALKEKGIELTAWWFPGTLNQEARDTLKIFKKHDVHPQLWISGGGAPTPAEQQSHVIKEANRIRPIAEAAAKIGCQVALYNHGGWFGEPENQIEIIKELKLSNVGIVYNLHHGHAHLERFESLLKKMKPYLIALNLNGMVTEGDKKGLKIVPVGAGEHDKNLLTVIARSGWKGPVGILDHDTSVDTKLRLGDNMKGLNWLRTQLENKPAGPAPKYRSWTNPVVAPPAKTKKSAQVKKRWSSKPPKEYEAAYVAELIKSAKKKGNAEAGMEVFASAKSACISCHKIGKEGGTVGPDLTQIGKQKTAAQIAEAILWPKREVKPEYVSHTVITEDGLIVSGYVVKSTDDELVLKNPASGELTTYSQESIDELVPNSTLMPEGLTASMTEQQQYDLVKFVSELGTERSVSTDKISSYIQAHQHSHTPAEFNPSREPLSIQDWPNWEHHVNRDRLYDFYAKEAEHFRKQKNVPRMLPAFPGLDGGAFGHWGNQNEETWASDNWNKTVLGSVQSGVLHGAGKPIARAVCVQLGDQGELSSCFNPETLNYDVVWKGGFVKFSSVRHGFVHGLRLEGTPLPKQEFQTEPLPTDVPTRYLGFYRHGKKVVFHYRIGDIEYYDFPWVIEGKFTRTRVPVRKEGRLPASIQQLLKPSTAQWPQQITTEIVYGTNEPYAIDTIKLPTENPWNALLFGGGVDFLPDGRALFCTMQGDVWLVDGLVSGSGKTATWKRFASGLHHALGLVVAKGEVYVLCRDQIAKLHDYNNDGEADYYECFSNAFVTSSAGHDFICGLQRDADGYFYTASGNQGVVQVSPDGNTYQKIATGFRNPDGLGLTPDGVVTVPCSEGSWTPASMICAFRVPAGGKNSNTSKSPAPYFGFGGPKNKLPPELPLVYIPRGVDNSSGGQTYIDSDQWGPLQGQSIHYSLGTGAHFLLLRDEVSGQMQGALVPLQGEFLSGVHRGRFNPVDGQLYTSGMNGWGCYSIEDGCFQRVRYTGKTVLLPEQFHVYENGITVKFTGKLNQQLVEETTNQFAQCWNYRYSSAYGSPEFSPSHHGTKGHDVLQIKSSHLLADGKTIFLELPELQPVNQLHLRLHVGETTRQAREGLDMFLTVHKLDKPFTKFPGYQPVKKTIAAHPILLDMALSTKRIPNPWKNPVPNARKIVLETGKNLTFKTKQFEVQAGEMLNIVLSNPDVVPHNWALTKPGKLRDVGELANKLIADPEAVVRHYIPQTDHVLFYTDVVLPKEEMSIYFKAPTQPGRYPYLCTFPGHWMVMNGTMIVK